MPAHIACPSCHARLRLTEQLPKNSRIGCSRCGKSFKISSPDPTGPNKLAHPPRRFDAKLAGTAGAVAALLLCLFVVVGRLLSGDSGRHSPSEDKPGTDQKAESEKPIGQDAPGVDDVGKKAAADQEKRREFGRLMERGNALLTADQGEDAQTAFREALGLFPDSREAGERLEKAREMFTRKKEKEARQKEVDQLLADAKEKEAELERKKKEAERLAAEGKAKAEAAAGDEQKKRQLFEKQKEAGRNALADNKTRDALAAFKAALDIVPDDPEAVREADRLQKGVDLLEKGLASLKAKHFFTAIKELDEYRKLFPNDPEGRRERDRASTEQRLAYDRFMYLYGQAQIEKKKQNLDKVVALLEQALAIYPSAKDGPGMVAFAKKEVAYEKYKVLSLQGKAQLNARYFKKAIEFFTEAVEVHQEAKDGPKLLEFAKKELDVAEKQAKALVEQADNDSTRESFASANTLYSQASRVFPEGKDARANQDRMHASSAYQRWSEKEREREEKEREESKREEKEREEKERKEKEREKEKRDKKKGK